MDTLKHLTLLHSNDLHGDFLPTEQDGKSVGGVARLSGYINQTRMSEKNVIYTMSGDMFRGSIIDSEYKGLSTIEIVNLLAPDVATIGNHEVDYGIAHLLFLERCTKFPIVNANMYIKLNHSRLFQSHQIIEIDSMKILFIGILTEEVLEQTKQEELIGSFVNIEEACEEVGKICDSYRTEDIDLTVLLTHIGVESDKRLAEMLDPLWGIDLILGGHSHTYMDEPIVVNNIPIVQAGMGTKQIGRFDLVINTERDEIESYEWKTIQIDETTAPNDDDLEKVITRYLDETNAKYGRVITRFRRKYTHPKRSQETQLGKLFSDILAQMLGLDVAFVASGSLRLPEMGPIVTYGDLNEMYPFVGKFIGAEVTGKQLKAMIKHIFRPEVIGTEEHVEYYQFSKGIRVVVSLSQKKVLEIKFNGEEIDDNAKFKVGFQEYHYNNLEAFFGISEEELKKTSRITTLATRDFDVIEEYLCQQKLIRIDSKEERWINVE